MGLMWGVGMGFMEWDRQNCLVQSCLFPQIAISEREGIGFHITSSSMNEWH